MPDDRTDLSRAPFPVKLGFVIALLALSITLNLMNGSYLAAVLGAVLVVFLILGSNTARSIAIGLTVIGLVFTVIVGLANIGAIPPGTQGLYWALIGVGAVQGGFTIWALMSADVIAWMDRRSLERAGIAPTSSRDEPPRYV